ncbi:sodium-dependent transporter [Heliobacterium gestii]|uniref:Transporter n=1 Tax=Heliomicrobium gestii TaxID=2699 RepID=A0A845LAC6_HELGE|nr:sodium-dependent transporter [Heliomicrobium gestii]MBM7867433.1 NSS family neurotransmitter:Na+ symporter [Heliomicrobium gestii]MZP43697.1 sodium-dependent transporter [Heliomicrobium gestii]
MHQTRNSRETFSSGLAVFFATLGSAVGLGNIWKFPYLVGANGGGAFLLVYFLCILFVGLPVMASEFFIGRKTRKNAIGAFEQLKPRSPWKHIGTMGVAASGLIMFFYSCVAGWVYYYLFKALRGDFAGVTLDSAKAQFGSVVTDPVSPILWQVIVMAVVSLILTMGVKKGIEKITKTLMPLLFLIIVIIDIRAITLPGASEGLKFLFHVDFNQLSGAVILTAMGLAFFKLSLGMGTMITYSSYFTEDNNLLGTAAKVAMADTLVSMLAGIAIFPTVFAFGMEPGAGPGLLFMTIPLVFSQLPFGNALLIAFFLLTSIAATTAMLSLVEVPVAYFSEERGLSRKTSVLLCAVVIVLLGIPASLSADSAGLLGGVTLFGKSFFDFYDFVSSNIMLPLGGLFIALFAGHVIDKAQWQQELTNQGRIGIAGVVAVVRFIARYVTPALLIIVFLHSIGVL